MKIITRQKLADSVVARFEEQYREVKRPNWPFNGVMEALKKLPLPVDPDEVDKIIGNKSWTNIWCDECENYVDAVVQVGQEPDYDSSTANLCVACVTAALKELTA